VDHSNNGTLELQEAIEFTKHIMERILQLRGQMPANITSIVGATPRMLLTSSGLTKPEFKQALAGLLRARAPGGNPKVVYIPDAAIGNGADVNAAFAGIKNQLMTMGITNVECMVLKGSNQAVLTQKLQGVDCVYVEMGNTFYLQYYARVSGFDTLILSLLAQGVVYVGVSSGAMAVGRTIDIAFWKGWDDPGYGQEWDLRPYGYDGLNLLPGGQSVFPHFSERWAAKVQQMKPGLGHEVILLDEDHVFVVEGNSGELVPPVPGGVLGIGSGGTPSYLGQTIYHGGLARVHGGLDAVYAWNGGLDAVYGKPVGCHGGLDAVYAWNALAGA